MVLALLESIYTSALLSPLRTHLPHIILSCLTIYVLHLLSQGRKTGRDRDLHARTVLLTGAFDSALGITLLVELAKRGASVVCLTDRDVGERVGGGVEKAQVQAKVGEKDEEKNPYEDEGDEDSSTAQDPTQEQDPLLALEQPTGEYGDPHIHTLVSLVRATTRNNNIWAETCDIEDPASVKQFCARWLTGGSDPTSKEALEEKEAKAKEPSLEGQGGGAAADQRLDAIVFTHEYASLGSALPSFISSSTPITVVEEQQTRERRSLGSFLMTTLLLPSLLVAPVERDIRIVNVVNPFYAAAVKGGDHSFTSTSTSSTTSATKASVFLSEGIRSLRTIIFTRHLQRILDALPAPQAPQTEGTASEIPIPARHLQRSNIVAVSVSPGIGRVDTIGRLVEGDWEASAPSTVGDERTAKRVGRRRTSTVGVILHILLQPLLRIFTKSPSSAVQSVLHALFLPTAFKSVPSDTTDEDGGDKSIAGQGSKAGEKSQGNGKEKKTEGNKLRFREVLKPGALYGECAVVTLDVPSPAPSTSTLASPPSTSSKTPAGSSASGKAKGAEGKSQGGEGGKARKEGGQEEVIEVEDDGEYGGEEVGRRVWEAYEGALKVWEGKADGGKSEQAKGKGR